MKKTLLSLFALCLTGLLPAIAQDDLSELPRVPFLTDPETFAESARPLLPSEELRDSASFLAGSCVLQAMKDTYGAFPVERFVKGLQDFQRVDLRDFNSEVSTGFALGSDVLLAFEINPERLDGLASVESPTPEQLDSLGYLLGVSVGYMAGITWLDGPRVMYGAEHANPRDRDIFPQVITRFNQQMSEAVLDNVRERGEGIYYTALQMGYKRIPQKYLGAKSGSGHVPLYFYEEKGDGAGIEFGDGFVLNYECLRVDGSTIDCDMMVIDSFDKDDFITGVVAALRMLHYGDVLKVVIPPEYAYGDTGNSNPWDNTQPILSGETLLFTLSLVDPEN